MNKEKSTLNEYKTRKKRSRKIQCDNRHYRNQYGTPLMRICAVIPFPFSILYPTVGGGDSRCHDPSLGCRACQKFVAP